MSLFLPEYNLPIEEGRNMHGLFVGTKIFSSSSPLGGINIPFPGGFSTHSSSNSQACSKNLGRIIGTGLRGVVFDERGSWVPQMRTYPK